MAAERSNKHWHRYVIESSSEDEGEEEASRSSSGSLYSTSSKAAKQTLSNPSAKTTIVTSAATDDAVGAGVASPNETARESPGPDNKLQAQMSQVRRWGEYDLEDSDSSDSDVLGSLGQRLKSSLRLTSPPSPSNNSRTSNENEEPRSRSREFHSLHSRKIDQQQKRIDAVDEVVELLDDDDVDEVEILGDSNAHQHGATSPRRKRPVHRPGGRLMDDDDESEVEAEYDEDGRDGASVSFESGSSSSSSGSVVWEEINRKESPQRRRGIQDRSRIHREAEHAGEGEEEEGQWNDDFLGMIPPESAWWYDQDKRHFYLEESEEEPLDSAANNHHHQQQRWPRLSVPMPLFRTLYTHQKSGVEWMAGLHVAGIGGILGDDMGMGAYRKTVE
jgi:SNF2 family DNA or RNA helicase